MTKKKSDFFFLFDPLHWGKEGPSLPLSRSFTVRWKWAVRRRWPGRWTCTADTWPSATPRNSSSASSSAWWRWPAAWPSVSGGGCPMWCPTCTRLSCRCVRHPNTSTGLWPGAAKHRCPGLVCRLCWTAGMKLLPLVLSSPTYTRPHERKATVKTLRKNVRASAGLKTSSPVILVSNFAWGTVFSTHSATLSYRACCSVFSKLLAGAAGTGLGNAFRNLNVMS